VRLLCSSIYPTRCKLYTVYLYLETALHVSSSTSTHHQERIQMYLQHLVFVTPLLPPAAMVEKLFQLLLSQHLLGGWEKNTKAPNLTFMGPCIVNIFQCIYNKMQTLHTFIHIWKLLYMFQVVPPPIIRSWNNSWWWVEVPPETCRAISRYK